MIFRRTEICVFDDTEELMFFLLGVKMPTFYRKLHRTEMTYDLLKMLETSEKRIKGSKGGWESKRKKKR